MSQQIIWTFSFSLALERNGRAGSRNISQLHLSTTLPGLMVNFGVARTVNSLAKAIKLFKGGTIVVTHNAEFLQETCDEIWHVEDGCVKIEGRHRFNC